MSEKLNHVDIPEQYEIMDTSALAEYLGYKPQTVQVYIVRGSWHKIPKPHRQLRTGPLWYLGYVKEWQLERGLTPSDTTNDTAGQHE